MTTERYLLDTNICIYIAKQRPPAVLSRFENLHVGDVGMSIVTHGELCFGAEKSQNAEGAFDVLRRLTELIPVLALPESAARHYGEVRAKLEQCGRPIGANDLWIAAHALGSGLVLVTNNTREFERVPFLALDNWV